jgi:hypothetical protein
MDHRAWREAGFCGKAISNYPFAVPSMLQASSVATPTPDASLVGLSQVAAQEKLAMSAYVAHLSGMGFDFWDYQNPWEHDSCIQGVWKLACYTYFPRCNEVIPGAYLRPCKSACNDYIKSCAVQCCDEGVQCTFTHETVLADGKIRYDHAYSEHNGPSMLCTGFASMNMRPGRLVLILLHGVLALALR